ncbi:hypothetical protein B0H17DRAFT_1180922 [Mycena rosella]|uniref:Uncharacterized protein n=1 Tax=Mycena rosella TaxID=1033263 RepID=A0AAD7DCM1_MYCRO|nr:hypothetical protein B0H17DRAFT_1180922 [Mycena rosella]
MHQQHTAHPADSDTTHVSDSEPEREARRRQKAPLSSISNTTHMRRTRSRDERIRSKDKCISKLEERIQRVESELGRVKALLERQLSEDYANLGPSTRPQISPPSPPPSSQEFEDVFYALVEQSWRQLHGTDPKAHLLPTPVRQGNLTPATCAASFGRPFLMRT